LDEYEQLLQVETIDIYNYISGKDKIPEHLEKLSIMKKLQNYTLASNMKSPEAYDAVKRKANLT
jgi:succinate dehydrogenase flavin-adding protein (antitoxin of CptAB toxin-antitoxin module)